MGEAQLKRPDPVQQALGQMYSEKSEGTLDAAKRIFRAHKTIQVHSELPGITPPEGSVTTVCCEHHLQGVIDEAFVNARSFVAEGHDAHIWFSV